MALDTYTMLLFTLFLSWIFALQLAIIRAYSGQRETGLLLWAGSFLLYGFGYLLLLLIGWLRVGPFYRFLFILILQASLVLLQLGWCRFFRLCSGRPFIVYTATLFTAATILNFNGLLSFEYIVSPIIALMMGWVALYIIRMYRSRHEASLLTSAAFMIIAFLSALVPILTDLTEEIWGHKSILTEIIEGFAYPLQDGCLMFSMILAILHRDRLHDRNMIREKERLVSELKTLTVTDPLTGISNRRGFLTFLDYEFKQLGRDGGYSIALGDIDYFKKVNDRWSHDCGDLVIKTIATTMAETIRSQDRLARWGGEEFIVLLKGKDKYGSLAVIERIRRKIESRIIAFNDSEIRVTMSFGLSPALREDKDGDAAVGRADALLYEAKKSGRNRSVSRQEANGEAKE